jgi:hypothetical protein
MKNYIMIQSESLRNTNFPINSLNKTKCDNKTNEACGLIEMSISNDLHFYLQGIEAIDAAWKKWKSCLGNIMRFEPTIS